MNVKAAVLFVVFASCFLFMLYKLMSSWFIDVLVVLFCIGGIEVLTSNKSVKNLYFCISVRKKTNLSRKKKSTTLTYMTQHKCICYRNPLLSLPNTICVFPSIDMLFSTKSSITICFLVYVCRDYKLAWLLFCPGVVYYLQ